MAKKIRGVKSIEKNGSVYWYVALGGKNPQYCGKGEEGREDAEEKRRAYLKGKRDARRNGLDLPPKKITFKTVKQLLNWYMELPRIQKQKSYSRKVNAVTHLLDYFGNTALHSVESDDVERYRDARGAAPNTINVEVAVLSGAFTAAEKANKIQVEMIPKSFFIEEDNNPRPIVTEEQYEGLLKNSQADFKDVLVCGFESAMRSGEIAGLMAYQVHLDEVESQVPKVVVSYIDLGIFDTKNKTRRTVPVSSALKVVLKRRMEGLEPEDYVFTSENGRRWDQSGISKRFKRACKRAKIDHGDKLLNVKGERIGLVYHCLRHTRVSQWVDAGYSDEIIRRATGHKSLEAYRRYIKLKPSVVMRLVSGSDSDKSYKEVSSQ